MCPHNNSSVTKPRNCNKIIVEDSLSSSFFSLVQCIWARDLAEFGNVSGLF